MKPNPAVFAGATANPTQARKDIRDFLNKAEGRGHIEIIMKDISTVKYDPQRLWDWEKICMEEILK